MKKIEILILPHVYSHLNSFVIRLRMLMRHTVLTPRRHLLKTTGTTAKTTDGTIEMTTETNENLALDMVEVIVKNRRLNHNFV